MTLLFEVSFTKLITKECTHKPQINNASQVTAKHSQMLNPLNPTFLSTSTHILEAPGQLLAIRETFFFTLRSYKIIEHDLHTCHNT